MVIDALLLDSLEDCLLLTDCRGMLLHANPAARSLLASLGISADGDGMRSIAVLGPALLEEPEAEQLRREILYKGVSFCITRRTVSEAGGWQGYLYLFADSLATSYRLAQLLRAVGNYITILNLDGYVEVAANSAEAQAADDLNMEECFGVNDIKSAKRPLEQTVFHRIIASKAPVKDRLEHSDGRYITWTGTPLLDSEGEVSKVVFTGKDITRAIRNSQRLHRAERQKGERRARLQQMKDFLNHSGLVYNSDRMGEVIRTAIKVAAVDVPVMITGESGVGKDVVADVIYQNSRRKAKPFLPINCAAIPENLVESELFGYEPGAFTGANLKGKVGLFEQADGGTIFLDEVGELPISVQPKLLRALQEGVITRVGGSRDIPVDIRFISATNITNVQLHNWEEFRQDLYYRLNGISLQIPPLRERREDVLPLAYHFLKFYSEQYGRSCKFDKTALNSICSYPWPGNVRELKNSIEVAVILAEGTVITAEHLPVGTAGQGDGVSLHQTMDFASAKALLEEKLVNLSLSECGSITGAARALGVASSTIYRKIATGKLRISSPNLKYL